MDKDTGLSKIHKKWFKSCKCELRNMATQPVPGEGSANAEIVFIGEAPGKNEDREGKPFIGRAGKFLSEMLETIKVKREDVYITNIVKYRPPDNRDPSLKEIDACRDWLLEEINFIKPKLIIFLGRHSMNHFFPTDKISEVHGKVLVKSFGDTVHQHFLALYHPAAALYNGGMREILLKDFQSIPLILKKIKTRKI